MYLRGTYFLPKKFFWEFFSKFRKKTFFSKKGVFFSFLVINSLIYELTTTKHDWGDLVNEFVFLLSSVGQFFPELRPKIIFLRNMHKF